MLHLRWCCEKRCKKPTKTPVIRDSLVIRSPAGEVQRHFGRISVGELGGQWDILDPWTMWDCCQKIEWRKNATGSGSFNCRLLRTFSNSASLRKVQMRSLRWDEILEIWQKPENKNTSALSVYQLNVIYIGKTCTATSSFGNLKGQNNNRHASIFGRDHWTRSERIAKVIQKLFCFPEMRDLILEHTIGLFRKVTELIINGGGQQRSQQWITIRHLLIMVSNDKRMHLRRLQKGQRERFQKRRPGWQATQKMSPMQSLQWWGHKRWWCCGWSWCWRWWCCRGWRSSSSSPSPSPLAVTFEAPLEPFELGHLALRWVGHC